MKLKYIYLVEEKTIGKMGKMPLIKIALHFYIIIILIQLQMSCHRGILRGVGPLD